MFYAAHGRQPVGQAAQVGGRPAHRDGFQAVVVGQVDVHDGNNQAFGRVLAGRQFGLQIAGVVVIDQGDDAGDRLAAAVRVMLRDGLAHQIGQQRGAAGRALGADQPVQG